MEGSFEENKTPFVIGLPDDANENGRNFKILTPTVERSCANEVLGKEFQKFHLKKNLQSGAKNESYSCDIWNEQFSDRNCLKQFCRTQSSKTFYSCDLCKKEFSRVYILKHHLRTHVKDKLYSCNVCKKQFSKKSSFIIHLRSHTNEKSFVCAVCRKQFSRKDSLIIHLRTHTNEKPFTCEVCRKEFSQKKYLRIHFHTHTKPFSCNVCNKTFSQKNYLNEHYHTHTNVKPYSCDVCSKQFFQKHYFNNHLRTHSKENLHSCYVCKKAFHQKSDLRKHYRTHTKEKPYSCDVCNKGFSQHAYLSEHYRMHTNEKPFSCDLCGKEFSWRASFRLHFRTHLNVKPFSCDVCNKAFSQKCHLDRHFRTCRGKEDRQFVIDVIQLYKKLTCLWKVADPDYHNKNKRGRAMEQLVDLFKTKDINANKTKVHNKINSLRDNYRKQSNKVKASLKSGASANKVHIPKLWYYNLLTFLEDQNIESTSGTMDSILDSMPFEYDEDYGDFNESASVSSSARSASMLQDSSQAQITSHCFQRPRSKTYRVLEKISKRLDQSLGKPAVKQKHDIFGECVAVTLRSLQPNMAIYCQKLITDAIFLAEIGNLNISSKIVTSELNSTDTNFVI